MSIASLETLSADIGVFCKKFSSSTLSETAGDEVCICVCSVVIIRREIK